MIVLNILCKNEAKVFEISKFLKQNHYALETYVDVNRLIDGMQEKVFVRIFFITKSLLFDIICKDLIENFQEEDLVVYSSPVTQIEPKYWEQLKLNLRQV